MQKYGLLKFRDLPLHSARGPVELFGKPFDGYAVNEAALDNGAVTLGVDVFCNNERDAAVGVLRL